jgi:DNA segregation ATPase FtsK/SpoIIIE, S-DNA-T family
MLEKEIGASVKEIFRILFAAFAVFVIISAFSYMESDISWFTTSVNNPINNFTGIVGAYFIFVFRLLFGSALWIMPVLCIYWSIYAVKLDTYLDFLKQITGAFLLIIASSSIYSLVAAENVSLIKGGIIGYLSANFFSSYFNLAGALLILSVIVLLSLLLATDFYFLALFVSAVKLVGGFFARVVGKKDGNVQEIQESYVNEKTLKDSEYDLSRKRNIEQKDRTVMPKTTIKVIKPTPIAPVANISSYGGKSIVPPINLLATQPVNKKKNNSENIEELSRILEETLRNFDIETKVVQVNPGPMILVFELQPAPGVKVSRITAVSNDIALALKAQSIRIVAPIPGKSVVGIEVPKLESESVYMRSLIEGEAFQLAESRLTLALGKDVSGFPVITALDVMPHLLIAGATGSGKTVCLNSLIVSLLYKASPEDVKLLLIDPKMVELTQYNGVPHLITPVVTDSKKAACALNWAVVEMEKRYELFAAVGVRNITGYNKRMKNMSSNVNLSKTEEKRELPKKLPYIVIVVDELADLMATAAQEVESSITRLAQLSRAAGLHIILATQRPSVNVITGLIKANFPCRIAFKVASNVDSRTILDCKGAEDLIGKGDMLFVPPGTSSLSRLQGSFVSDEEIKNIVNFLQKTGSPEYNNNIFNVNTGTTLGTGGDEDQIYDEAVRIVLESGQGSASFLQRRLRVGYNRAARLIEAMEEKGIVSASRGSKPREVLIGQDEYADL